jgi:hypothetical protein
MFHRVLWRLTIEFVAALRSLAAKVAPALASIRRALVLVLQVVAALILLFEEWGWRPLVAGLERLARFRVVARIELFIAGLPPYGALLALALPTTLLFPLKFLSIYLLANGQFFLASALFVFAKIASTAFIARIFLLTKPALMRIGWFARAHDWIMPWKDAIFAAIRSSWPWRYGRMLKTRVKLETKQAWMRWRPAIVDAYRRLRADINEVWAAWRPELLARTQRLREALRQLFASR